MRAYKQRVAVIGCGAAGLCMLKHLTHSNGDISQPLEQFEAVGFEQQDHIGGTWVYSEKVGCKPWQCNIYKNLITNLPKQVMSFRTFPYPTTAPMFQHHTDVLAYLQNYARHFGLYQHIKFQTQVTLVEPCLNGCCDISPPVKWKVTYKKFHERAEMETKESQIFDAVAVCNGHFSVPYSPTFLGEEKFQGEIFHSHNYRSPDGYSGKTILCVGTKNSGVDIGIELSSVARKVFLSYRDKPLISELPINMVQKPEIQEFTRDSVIFKNGDRELVDVVVLCTGYTYSFPFFDNQCNVKMVHNRVTPLYKHLVHTDFHNLFFIGICMHVAPFLLFDIQAAFCRAVLLGQLSLPSTDEMIQDTNKDYEERLKSGMPKHHAHVMGQRQWEYNDELADLSHTPRLPIQIKNIYNDVAEKRDMYPMKYKTMSFRYEDK